MVRLLRHRQTKGAVTDRLNLRPPRHILTLPKAAVRLRSNRTLSVRSGADYHKCWGESPRYAVKFFYKLDGGNWFLSVGAYLIAENKRYRFFRYAHLGLPGASGSSNSEGGQKRFASIGPFTRCRNSYLITGSRHADCLRGYPCTDYLKGRDILARTGEGHGTGPTILPTPETAGLP